MGLLKVGGEQRPVHLVLNKNQQKNIKRGSPWIYSDALRELPPAPAGSLALLKTKEGDIIAKGLYDPLSKLAFRVVAQRERLDDALIATKLQRAVALRRQLFPDAQTTSGYRVLNGEGDGLPGLVCDVYGDTAVFKLDGDGPAGFYNVQAISKWLSEQLPQLRTCLLKHRAGEATRAEQLWGAPVDGRVQFLENGLQFEADVVQGQKTGFFLDQRDNRARMRPWCKGARVLNLFGYTGGFSIYAGAAGASHVTTVDLARPALDTAAANWALNGLNPAAHETAAVDAFQFLESARSARERWDVVVVDPPSFAPNKSSLERALASYKAIFAAAASVTAGDGVLALSSCSSHVNFQAFGELCEESLGKARRQGACLGVHGQPPDHPYQVAHEEFRYLKFQVLRLEPT